jgi:hypothetical protein
MRFDSLVGGIAASFALVLPLQAAVVAPRAPNDMIAMQQIFDKIFTAVEKTTEHVRAFTGEPAQLQTFVADSAAIQAILNEGTARMKKSVGMGIPDILTILGPVGVMESEVAEVVDALKRKKAEIEKISASKTVIEELTKLRVAADNLISAIIGNLPLSSVVGIVAGPIAKQITNRLDGGIKAFGGEIPAGPPPPPKAAPGPKAGGPAPPRAGKGKGVGPPKGGAPAPQVPAPKAGAPAPQPPAPKAGAPAPQPPAPKAGFVDEAGSGLLL